MVMSADVYHVILGAKASGYMAGARWTHPPICPRQTKNNTLTSFVLRVQKQTDATQYKPISSLELSGGKCGLSTLCSWDLHISASIECRHRIGPRFYPWPAATVNNVINTRLGCTIELVSLNHLDYTHRLFYCPTED